MHLKKEAYRRGVVQEYLVWQVYEQRIDWWSLEDGEYAPLEPDAAGVIESNIFPGLRLNAIALLEGAQPAVLAALTSPGETQHQ
jgi:hypothetical protein